MEFKLFPRLYGMFSRWYCPKCKSKLKRRDVKYQSEFRGIYTVNWFMCLKCGNKDNVEAINDAIERMVL